VGSQRAEPYKLNALVVGGLTIVCLESDMCVIYVIMYEYANF
jgi:hypothetical protein